MFGIAIDFCDEACAQTSGSDPEMYWDGARAVPRQCQGYRGGGAVRAVHFVSPV